MQTNPKSIEFEHTKQIKNWLPTKSKKIWKQDPKNPNKFTSNFLEALYVYSTTVIYWEDIRVQSVRTEHIIPQSKSDLLSILAK